MVLKFDYLSLYAAPLELTMNFINDSPRVDGSTISGDIQVSRPVTLIRCALSGLPYQDCESVILWTFLWYRSLTNDTLIQNVKSHHSAKHL